MTTSRTAGGTIVVVSDQVSGPATVRRTTSGVVRAALRAVLVVDGVVFLLAATLNFGARIPLGVATLRFGPVWQAGIGEAVIGVLLLLAALTRRRSLAWVAFALSVLGIAIGLRSTQVVGAARDIHLVLVPLAVVLLVLLVWPRRRAP